MSAGGLRERLTAGLADGFRGGLCGAKLRVGGLGATDEVARAVARLSAAADDAEGLAVGLGGDAALAATMAESLPAGSEYRLAGWLASYDDKAGRLARVAARCAEEALRLRALADAVQAVLEPEAGLCGACGERPADVAGLCFGCAARVAYGPGGRL